MKHYESPRLDCLTLASADVIMQSGVVIGPNGEIILPPIPIPTSSGNDIEDAGTVADI